MPLGLRTAKPASQTWSGNEYLANLILYLRNELENIFVYPLLAASVGLY